MASDKLPSLQPPSPPVSPLAVELAEAVMAVEYSNELDFRTQLASKIDALLREKGRAPKPPDAQKIAEAVMRKLGTNPDYAKYLCELVQQAIQQALEAK